MRALRLCKMAVAVVTALSVGLLAGCDDLGMSVSLHPIANSEQPEFEPVLLGRWKMVDGDDVMEFQKSANGDYRLLIFKQSTLDADPEPVPEERYAVQALRLGRYIFLDLSEPSGGQAVLQVPAHLFVRLDVSSDEFQLAVLNDRWLKDGLQQKRLDIAHEIVGGQVVLTAAPHDLRKFLQRNAWDDQAFPPDTRYRRVSAANVVAAPGIDSSQ